ncbi:MAG: glycosyltransferase family 2 protein [Bacteroidales bacterium]
MIPIISVITPSFNQSQFIAETIESVLTQQGDFYIDYIIIDGASTDNSQDIITHYEKLLKDNCHIETINGLKFFIHKDGFKYNQCKGISYRWISETDRGHGDALNKGFSLSIGDIMCWLNSDDIFLNNSFSTITEIYSQFDDVKWTTAINLIITKDGQRHGMTYLGRFNYKNIYSFLTNDYEFIQQEVTFWRRELWEKAGGKINTQYKFMVDGELWCRFFLYENIYHINRELGAYRLHGSNRAHKNMAEVKSEMKTAISELERKAPAKIKEIANNLSENAPGFVVINDDMNFKIIDKNEEQGNWFIREVDFLAYSIKRHSYNYKTLYRELNELRIRTQAENIKLKNSLNIKDNITNKLKDNVLAQEKQLRLFEQHIVDDGIAISNIVNELVRLHEQNDLHPRLTKILQNLFKENSIYVSNKLKSIKTLFQQFNDILNHS